MREIKFRGKWSNSNSWVYGAPVFDSEGVANIAVSEYDSFKNSFVIKNYHVLTDSIGQYTGLKDRRGVKIYEGDVLQGFADFPKAYEVFYENGSFRLRYLMREGSYFDWGPLHRIFELNGMYAEVIGNIFDNPELITQ